MESKELQIEREKDRIEEFRGSLQLCTMGLAVPLYFLFWIADILYVPHLKWEFLFYRLSFLPIPIAVFYFSRKAQTLRSLQALALAWAIPASLFITLMIFRAEGVSSPYYAGLNLVLLATLAFFPWSRIGQILLILSVWGLYYLWGFYSQPEARDLNQLAIYSFFNASTIIISLIIRLFYNRLRFKEIKARLELNAANRFIRETFGRYMSSSIVENILKSPEGMSLGGEKRSVTLTMTDLRGFTPISEQLKPEQVVQLLNNYFEVMIEVVQQHEGTILEISGDAMLILFGAPQEIPDRAQRAVACSMAMQNAMAKVNEQNRLKGLPELQMGIGINETEVIIGNVGSSKRSKYGVVGSGVNMTSRIQSYAIGGQVLISDSVRKDAGDVLRIDGRLEVHPKGAETALTIYEVGGIGGSYNITLEDRGARLVDLLKEIPVRYRVLDGKDAGGAELSGGIYRLSLKSGELKIESALEPLTNLKFNLSGVSQELSSKDIYAKVEKDCCSDASTCRVSFTAVPPAIYGYFQAILDREVV